MQMLHAVRERIVEVAPLIVESVRIGDLVDHLQQILLPGQSAFIKGKPTPLLQWNALYGILQRQETGFFHLCKALKVLQMSELILRLNPATGKIINGFVGQYEPVEAAENQTFQLSRDENLSMRAIQIPIGNDATIPLMQLKQSKMPVFYLTAPKLAAWTGQIDQLLSENSPGYHVLAPLGPELDPNGIYSGVLEFDPGNAIHAGVITGHQRITHNTHIAVSEPPPGITRIYDGLHCVRTNSERPVENAQRAAEDKYEAIHSIVLANRGMVSMPLLQLSTEQLQQLRPTLRTGAILLEILPNLPLPELCPAFFSPQQQIDCAKNHFQAISAACAHHAKKIEKKACDGCKNIVTDHTCTKDTHALIRENKEKLLGEFLVEPLVQHKILLLAQRISEPHLHDPQAMAAVSAKIHEKLMEAGDRFLVELIVYYTLIPFKTVNTLELLIFLNTVFGA